MHIQLAIVEAHELANFVAQSSSEIWEPLAGFLSVIRVTEGQYNGEKRAGK